MDDIVLRYRSGQSSLAIAAALGLTKCQILRHLRREGEPRRTMSQAKRLYDCDHSFFDHVNTEPKAYWLGFFAADGGIGEGNHTLHLELAERDRAHVEAFRTALGSTHRIYNRPHPALCISSPQMTRALAQYGVTPRKTFTLPWPDLAETLLPHYLRGYFDGDGCVTGMNRADHCLSFSLAGNLGFLLVCQRYLVNRCSLRTTRIIPMSRTPQCGYLTYCGTGQVQVIARLMYEDATIWLERKRAIFRAYPARRGQYGQPSIQTQCKRGHSFTEANTYLCAGRRTCRACQRLRQQSLRQGA